MYYSTWLRSLGVASLIKLDQGYSGITCVDIVVNRLSISKRSPEPNFRFVDRIHGHAPTLDDISVVLLPTCSYIRLAATGIKS